MQTGKNILICPLEWGLGHAGRMVPLAKNLIDLGQNVFIGSGSEHLEFFRKEIPGINCILFPGFRVRYSSWLPQYLVILLQIPAFIRSIKREHRELKKIIARQRIDIVISDSRPGLWNKTIKTVFVTHMIRVPLPKWALFLNATGLFTSKRIIRKFTFCYIPDLEGENNLSGSLSHNIKLPGNARYIGILSRFSQGIESFNGDKDYFCAVVLSGPEPQRGILMQKMAAILRSGELNSVILGGRPELMTEKLTEGKVTYISHLATKEMAEVFSRSKYIVSRAGYTTLMELASIGKHAIIIPTPGQTEQEYLAEYLSGKGWCTSIAQKDLNDELFNIGAGIRIPGDLKAESEKMLDSALRELLE